jgi:hypothetical protein
MRMRNMKKKKKNRKKVGGQTDAEGDKETLA